MSTVAEMRKEVAALREQFRQQQTRRQADTGLGRYRRDPVGYCRDILHLELTEKQQEIARLLLTPPYKVLVRAAHNVGKSCLAAALISWWYDSHNPGVCLSTAPTERQVEKILWKELRGMRAHLGGFPGPSAPTLQRPGEPHHFASGVVARTAEGFQGQHGAAVFIVLDEAVGVAEPFWTSAETMLGGDEYGALAIFNPTDTGSYAYAAEMTGTWHVVEMSAVHHPNIVAQLAGQPPTVPNAIRLDRLTQMLEAWSTPVVGPAQPGDLEWPPGSGRWLRPGPDAESRLLGRWPSSAVNSIWSEATWQLCLKPAGEDGPLTIGLDVARFGDDATTCWVKKGPSIVEYQKRVKLDTTKTAQLARDMAVKWGTHYNLAPKSVQIRTDDAGLGAGVTDQLRVNGWNCIPCLGASRALNVRLYPNRRSETWFEVADLAAAGKISVARLAADTRAELQRQLLGVKYKINTAGQREVESKDVTKARLKKSPDEADGFLLACCTPDNIAQVATIATQPEPPKPPAEKYAVDAQTRG